MIAPIDRYAVFLQQMSVEDLDRLPEYVTSDVHFSDPFNDATGVNSMRRIFLEMFEQVGPVRLKVLMAKGDTKSGILVWQFHAKLRGKPWVFEGTSVIKFAADGRVSDHVDHWDAARHFYEHLPVIGWLISSVRRRLAIQ